MYFVEHSFYETETVFVEGFEIEPNKNIAKAYCKAQYLFQIFNDYCLKLLSKNRYC